MQFEKNFFDAEYIDDFFVDSRMKRFWAASIETLEEINKVCKKHNITWYADWGTLLGTVRHKGFIPWDDDLDIAMKRNDYEKFLRVAPQELPEHYRVFDGDSEKFWCNNAAYVANWDNENYLILEQERLKKYHGCPFYIGIDIFALDYMYRNTEQEKFRKQLLMEIWHAIAAVESKQKSEQISQRIQTIETIAQIKIPDWHGDDEILKWQLRHLSDTVFQICSEKEADELAELRWLYVGEYTGAHFNKEWYDEVVYMPFHGFQMPVPKEYDKILKGMYGDYMIPVQGTASHDYPKFKGQMEIFNQWKKPVNETRNLERIIQDLMGENQ